MDTDICIVPIARALIQTNDIEDRVHLVNCHINGCKNPVRFHVSLTDRANKLLSPCLPPYVQLCAACYLDLEKRCNPFNF